MPCVARYAHFVSHYLRGMSGILQNREDSLDSILIAEVGANIDQPQASTLEKLHNENCVTFDVAFEGLSSF